MKRWITFFPLVVYLFQPLSASAADIRHTFGGSSLNSFYVDDRGGSVHNGGNNLSYYLNLNDVDESAFGTLLLYSHHGNETAVEDGLVDQDFVNGSGIGLFDLKTTIFGIGVDGEIGLADDSPLTPVSFDGNSSGLKVEQVTYTSATVGDRFIVMEYRVVNPTQNMVQVKLALANDFDVDQKSIDAKVGFSNSGIPFVYQQEAAPLDPNNTTVGVGLIDGTLAGYRLEVCSGPGGSCAIFANDGDLIRKAFFEGASGQTGDLTQGIPNQDFASTIAADLGTLAPGEGRTAVFCYHMAQGNDGNTALNNDKQSVLDCKNFYESKIDICSNGLINFGETCDDNNKDNNDDCPDGTNGTCRQAVCGDGFVWNEGSGTEECDNGTANSNTTPDACRKNCRNPSCGDGVVDTGEQCDDGNANPNDACKNDCTLNVCGDGVVRFGVELCDNGASNGPGGCALDCQSFDSCGNGTLELGEACDDGNDITSDACPSGPNGTCQAARCGDGYLQVGIEECDDGNNTDGDGCSATCHNENAGSVNQTPPPPPPICGNNVIETGEQCDGGDNCDGNCQLIPILQGGASQNPNSGIGVRGCALNPGSASASWDANLFSMILSLGLFGWVRRISLRKNKTNIGQGLPGPESRAAY
jgi:cysteine-rich repeat protein